MNTTPGWWTRDPLFLALAARGLVRVWPDCCTAGDLLTLAQATLALRRGGEAGLRAWLDGETKGDRP